MNIIARVKALQEASYGVKIVLDKDEDDKLVVDAAKELIIEDLKDYVDSLFEVIFEENGVIHLDSYLHEFKRYSSNSEDGFSDSSDADESKKTVSGIDWYQQAMSTLMRSSQLHTIVIKNCPPEAISTLIRMAMTGTKVILLISADSETEALENIKMNSGMSLNDDFYENIVSFF